MDRDALERLHKDACHAHDAAFDDHGWRLEPRRAFDVAFDVVDALSCVALDITGVDTAVEKCAELDEAITSAQTEMRAAIARLDVLAVEMRRIVDAAVVAAEVER